MKNNRGKCDLSVSYTYSIKRSCMRKIYYHSAERRISATFFFTFGKAVCLGLKKDTLDKNFKTFDCRIQPLQVQIY